MADITINKLNELYIQVKAERGVIAELAEEFVFEVKGAKWNPKHINNGGPWDGKIRLLNSMTGVIYAGLEPKIKELAERKKYTFVGSDNTTNVIPDDYAENLFDIYNKDPNLEKREYQLRSVQDCIREKRQLLLSPTSSGKSFSIYLLSMFLTKIKGLNVLIIVPSTGLVSQFKKDIITYSGNEVICHEIYSGKEKIPEDDVNITISTWQSIYKLPKGWFKRYGAIIGDEAHEYTATSLKTLMENTLHIEYRYGFTGTVDDEESKSNPLVLQGMFGRLNQVITTKELIDDGTLAEFKIKCVVLKHSPENRMFFAKKKPKYPDESKFISTYKPRNRFIANMAKSFDGNVLIFVEKRELHGDLLYEILKDTAGKNVHYIKGDVSVEKREAIRAEIEKSRNNIVIATYGTTSRGVNMVNLDYIIMAFAVKSKYRNLQSIGRVLRKGKSKFKGILIEISDDLRHKKYVNHSMNHLMARVKLYNKEGFDYDILTKNLKE